MSRVLPLVVLAILLSSVALAQDPNDPGTPDTFRIGSTTLTVGQSMPVRVWYVNDQLIDAGIAVLKITGLNGGFARYDSVTFTGRLADPSVLNNRVVNESMADGVSPDSLLVMSAQAANGNDLASGEGFLYTMWFTGLTPGLLVFDSLHWLENMNISFVAQLAPDQFQMFSPYFRPETLKIIESNLPPVVILPEPPAPMIIGQTFQFDVSASSPQGWPVTMSPCSLTYYDDPEHRPTSQPTLSGNNPATFTWSPGPADVGIWNATFGATDSTYVEGTQSMVLQVVSAPQYLTSFDRTKTPTGNQSIYITHGDLDNDNLPETFATGSGLPYSYATYGLGPSEAIEELFGTSDGFGKGVPCLGYYDSDSILDVALTSRLSALVLSGLGDNTFVPHPAIDLGVHTFAPATSGNWNNDAALDMAIGGNGLQVLLGDGAGNLLQDFPILPDTSLSLSAADFNRDGWDDIALGTLYGLDIFLNNQHGGFDLTHTYYQTFGSRDIRVTNQGSDINNDGLYDLCLSTPSVGGWTSDLMLYLGHADGSFTQQKVRTVLGQIFANAVGDLNGDTYLDIAFVNGSHKYLSLLFGDGTGAFANELRYEVPSFTPFQVDCMDIDVDGDMDILVAAYDVYDSGAFFLYRNQLNPTRVAGTLKVKAQNNASLSVVAPNGAPLDEVKQVMPAASYYRRALDANVQIDAVATIGVLQPGAYLVHVAPKPHLDAASPFSLSYELAGKQFCIARDLPMTPLGYDFIIYPDGSSPIHPLLGEYIASPHPSFSWLSAGAVRFELATDAGFASIIDSATVATGTYTTDVTLDDDSTAYYWRTVPAAGAAGVTTFNSFIVVKTPTAVDEPGSHLPKSFALKQNYPNPFNPVTTISYDLPSSCHVTLEIYNLLGQQVSTLVDRVESAGTRQVEWNGTDNSGHPVTSGIYFYRLTAGDFHAGAKMLLLK